MALKKDEAQSARKKRRYVRPTVASLSIVAPELLMVTCTSPLVECLGECIAPTDPCPPI